VASIVDLVNAFAKTFGQRVEQIRVCRSTNQKRRISVSGIAKPDPVGSCRSGICRRGHFSRADWHWMWHSHSNSLGIASRLFASANQISSGGTPAFVVQLHSIVNFAQNRLGQGHRCANADTCRKWSLILYRPRAPISYRHLLCNHIEKDWRKIFLIHTVNA
jgi:hypothetical protein